MADTSTILLVDDEDSVQKLLTYPLERDGFKVVHARDGEEALARFAEEVVGLEGHGSSVRPAACACVAADHPVWVIRPHPRAGDHAPWPR